MGLAAVTELIDSPPSSANSQADIAQYIQVVYPELRRIAHIMMRSERPGHTLIPTALLHEAVIRLLGLSDLKIMDGRHLLLIAVIQMRRVLASYARRKLAQKRSAGISVSSDDWQEPRIDVEQIVIVDQMMDRLSATDERAFKVVSLRFFGGFSLPETASILQISETTAERDWKFAKLWLYGEYQGTPQL